MRPKPYFLSIDLSDALIAEQTGWYSAPLAGTRVENYCAWVRSFDSSHATDHPQPSGLATVNSGITFGTDIYGSDFLADGTSTGYLTLGTKAFASSNKPY